MIKLDISSDLILRKKMFGMDLTKMLFCIPPEDHGKAELEDILGRHPEVKFVSLVGVDIGGHDTDEKIPVKVFLDDYDRIMQHGVQTDGSSAILPKIAELNDARIDIIPDPKYNWYVDHNLKNIDYHTDLPVGTLRIPSKLVHNLVQGVGVRTMLEKAMASFKKNLMQLLREHPYVFDNLSFDSVDDIASIDITSATELEFWVKTPDEEVSAKQLSTAQTLKEQYWKRTVGGVRTALEDALTMLDCYGMHVEMGHKEVGGVKAHLEKTGHYDHVMEQLEIDWRYTNAVQAADNENMVKYVVRDVFRMFGLDVTYRAKPIDGVAGSGEHTHLGVAVTLKDGSHASLFSPKNLKEDFLSPIGYGAIMGLLNNYDIINPFISATNDAFNRLKPGYEAPVSAVTSLGISKTSPSRNRTVLAGVIRDVNNPLATRFELRSPNPHSDTYIVLAAAYMAMLDGIEAVLTAEKTSEELEKSMSKEPGVEDFYLDKDRAFRSEKNIFTDFTEEEREKRFGPAPHTVYENLCAFRDHPDKVEILKRDGVIDDISLESYCIATLAKWKTDLLDRIMPNVRKNIQKTRKLHDDSNCTDYDIENWEKILRIRRELGKDSISNECMLTKISKALHEGDYAKASDLQIEMQKMVEELNKLYAIYKRNIF